MCLRLDAVGKSVKATKKGVVVPTRPFELFGRPMVALTCFPGVVGYSCLDPEQESRPDPKDATGLALAGPGGAAAAGFVVGFLAGAKRKIPEETWTRLSETLSQPLNQRKFQAGMLLGRPLGVVASLEDLLKGLGELLKLSLELSPLGLVGTELYARFKGEESPTVRRPRMATRRSLCHGSDCRRGARIPRYRDRHAASRRRGDHSSGQRNISCRQSREGQLIRSKDRWRSWKRFRP